MPAHAPSSHPASCPCWNSLAVAALVGLFLPACTAVAPTAPEAPPPIADRVQALLPTNFLLIGEQHDAPDHQRIEREVLEALAARGQLAGLALEMAEQGQDTRGLAPQASEAQVRTALRWNDAGWPWKAYGPVVMTAVQAGVPVLGANLPRARMKDAMGDVSLDAQLNPQALAAQQDAVRAGHCDALPESQIGPMTRIQIARDRAMAQTLIQAKSPGKTVVLVSGSGHSPRVVGVPQHLPTDMEVRVVRLVAGEAGADDNGPAVYDAVWRTPALPPRDYCAEFKANRPAPAAK
ncbi:MAG: ChaN family lipoprotein [Proteobacteria bacterium]|nr:ChaN family lipoprotein [Pseudomonadota bacterium]